MERLRLRGTGINFSAIRSLFRWRGALPHGAFLGLLDTSRRAKPTNARLRAEKVFHNPEYEPQSVSRHSGKVIERRRARNGCASLRRIQYWMKFQSTRGSKQRYTPLQ